MSATSPGHPLEDQLWGIVAAGAASAGLPFTPPCEIELREFIEAGVARLLDTGAGTQEIAQAEENLRRLIQGMVAEVQASGGSVLTEISFRKIKDLLCPIYPFC